MQPHAEGNFKMKKISIFVGSLRKESFNRKMANALIRLAPESLKPEILEIGHLSMYNQTLDSNPPAEWEQFRASIRASDGLLFLTPEYNRSFSGLIKNAIDIGSRPAGQGSWRKKPGGVITVTPGTLGGMAANYHLRQVLNAVGVMVLPQPDAFIANAGDLFDDKGDLVDEKMKEHMTSYLDAFSNWVVKNS
jgi:chromate reductase